MKCLWARVRESKKAKKKKKINTVTLHWEMCAFFHCLRNSNSVRWFTIAKCTCIHDSVLFFLFVCCVLFTAIITVFFFAKRQHRHCTMHTNSIPTKIEIGMLWTEFSVQCKQHCRIKLFARNKKNGDNEIAILSWNFISKLFSKIVFMP